MKKEPYIKLIHENGFLITKAAEGFPVNDFYFGKMMLERSGRTWKWSVTDYASGEIICWVTARGYQDAVLKLEQTLASRKIQYQQNAKPRSVRLAGILYLLTNDVYPVAGYIKEHIGLLVNEELK